MKSAHHPHFHGSANVESRFETYADRAVARERSLRRSAKYLAAQDTEDAVMATILFAILVIAGTMLTGLG